MYDDASTDDTAAVAEQYTRSMPVRVIRGTRHLGYAGAIEALLRYVASATRYPRRDAVLLMQADFTDPPVVIPEFARRFDGGADLVVGERTVVADAPAAVRRLFRSARWVLRPFVRVDHVRDLTSSMRLVRIAALRDILRATNDAPVICGDTLVANADLLLRLVPHTRRVESVPMEPTYGVRMRGTRRAAMRDTLALLSWAWRARGRHVTVGAAIRMDTRTEHSEEDHHKSRSGSQPDNRSGRPRRQDARKGSARERTQEPPRLSRGERGQRGEQGSRKDDKQPAIKRAIAPGGRHSEQLGVTAGGPTVNAPSGRGEAGVHHHARGGKGGQRKTSKASTALDLPDPFGPPVSLHGGAQDIPERSGEKSPVSAPSPPLPLLSGGGVTQAAQVDGIRGRESISDRQDAGTDGDDAPSTRKRHRSRRSKRGRRRAGSGASEVDVASTEDTGRSGKMVESAEAESVPAVEGYRRRTPVEGDDAGPSGDLSAAHPLEALAEEYESEFEKRPARGSRQRGRRGRRGGARRSRGRRGRDLASEDASGNGGSEDRNEQPEGGPAGPDIIT